MEAQEARPTPNPNGYLMLMLQQIVAGQETTHQKLDELAAIAVKKADCDACKEEQTSKYVDKRLFVAGVAILGSLIAVGIAITSVLTLFLKGAEFAKFIGLLA